ncbi:MAG: prolyl oligopeptidase family serine peptidase [Bacilli bacterium]|nr:prolyl oligopeptidase family serine peptidase [Bacilli bacterium]
MKKSAFIFPLSLLCLSACQGAASSSSAESSSPIEVSSSAEAISSEASSIEVSSEEPKNPAIEVEDGRCQPIYEINQAYNEHNPKTSTIARFTVYVETDYDTDLDGKNDLVKALIQLPKSILEKGYQVATIIEASPYTAATTDLDYEELMEGYDQVTDEDLSKSGTKREATSEIDLLSHNAAIDTSEFSYTIDKYDYFEDAQDCDYFLARGFAYANIGGYGTLGSDGIETMGARLETHAYGCLIDWLNGERVAFSDHEGTHTVKATFSNGNYGAQGCSYLGTTAYQLGCSGYKGLKAIVPQAGIASWYEYTNSQGAGILTSPNAPWLSLYCASAMLDEDVSDEYAATYGGYLAYMNDQEISANGDYTSFWEERDYTKNITPSCPALIVHGMNDFNVTIRNSALMYKTLKDAGQTAKLIFHQGDHLQLAGKHSAYSIDNYEESFFEVLNRWYSHYLYDVDNGIEDFPDFTYQSNVDGRFYGASDFLDAKKKAISLSNPSRQSITSENMEFYYQSWNDTYYDRDDDNTIVYDLGAAEADLQIKGIPELNISLKTDDVERDNLHVTAVLLDTYEEEFDAYGAYDFYPVVEKNLDESFEVYPGLNGTYREILPEKTTAKAISTCTFDLYNPGERAFGEPVERTELEAGKYYDYQVYFDPTAYTLRKGHALKCLLFTFDPGLFAKSGYFADEEGEVYDPYGDVFFTPGQWTTTEPYGYSINAETLPVLTLPYSE